ncbi:MAG: hypothetical protein AB7Q97_18105 [Gammaproteobacteria bacterium]
MALPALRALRTGDERPLSSVPRAVLLALAISLPAHALWRIATPATAGVAQDLPPAPAAAVLRAAAFGEPAVVARLLSLWLLAFDDQPAVDLAYRALDYDRVIGWLDAMLALDPRFAVPLLAASRLYTQVPVPTMQRRMLEFVHREFLRAPARRWPWMAHAVYVARHRLHDPDLALRYARSLAVHTRPGQAPEWARQMHIFVLADMGRTEAAKVLLGALLASGQITDPHELALLRQRMEDFDRGGP